MEPDDFHPDGLPGDLPVAQASYSRGFMDGMIEGRKQVLAELVGTDDAALGEPLVLDWNDGR